MLLRRESTPEKGLRSIFVDGYITFTALVCWTAGSSLVFISCLVLAGILLAGNSAAGSDFYWNSSFF
jgi:hypothetical protein